MIRMQLKENHIVEVPLSVALCMGTVKSAIEDCIHEDDICIQFLDIHDEQTRDEPMSNNPTRSEPTRKLVLDLMPIPIPNVERSIMEKIVEFYVQWLDPDSKTLNNCEECCSLDDIHRPSENRMKEEKECVPGWIAKYVDMPHSVLFPTMNAANFLNCPELLNVLAAEVANQIRKCSSTEDMRRHFHIVNDFTPEEQAKVNEEIQWCKNIIM